MSTESVRRGDQRPTCQCEPGSVKSDETRQVPLKSPPKAASAGLQTPVLWWTVWLPPGSILQVGLLKGWLAGVLSCFSRVGLFVTRGL